MSDKKSQMRPQDLDENTLVRYLLGSLTEAGEIQVEDRAFSDSEFMGRLEAVEADLIDAYVQGQLPQDQTRAFETRFLASPQRRNKVEFAAALAKVTLELKQAPSSTLRVPLWQRLPRFSAEWTPAFQVAGACLMLMCVAGAAWLAVQNRAMRSQLATLEAERRGLLEQQKQEQAPNNPTAALATLVLFPGLSRSQARAEQLVLKPGTQLANIEIQLESHDDFPQFQAELRTRAGDEVLIRSGLNRRQSGAVFAISFDVPASALTPGEYELTLRGLRSNLPPQEIGYYYFSVRRQ